MVKYSIPQIFDGGVYGTLCRNKRTRNYKIMGLYLAALSVLGLNAFLVWLDNSPLGIIGLITNLVYDMFIFAFSALQTEERSIRNIFLLVFLGRILSFIFGEQLWIFGYCFLYFIVGVFIGKVIIEQRLPLRKARKNKHEHRHHEEVNALKTPEFVLLLLTAEIFFLVLAASLGVGGANLSLTYKQSVTINLWSFALLAVMVTWVVVLFLTSFRIYQRQRNNIHEETEFYFGLPSVRSHHVAYAVTYLIVVGLGVYCHFILHEPAAFLSCLFLPPVLLILIKFEHEWQHNEYQILADINDYNERVRKAKRVIQKKQQALLKQQRKISTTVELPSTIQVPVLAPEEHDTSKLMLMGEVGSEKGFSETTTQVEEREAAQQ
jgi:membrane protein implicated in regulation of membrane protease activity